MVAIRTGSLINGMSMEVMIPNYFPNIEERYGVPLYCAHRIDLHSQLKLLAIQEEGSGYPVDVRVQAKVVDFVSQEQQFKPVGFTL